MKANKKIVSIYCIFYLLAGCKSDNSTIKGETENTIKEDEIDCYRNSVKGHIESDIIIGNFTGLGIDTLYITEEIDYSEWEPDPEYPEAPISILYEAEHTTFYARSNNPKIPDLEIYGHPYLGCPFIVFEGDLDGDGKDEWGYTHIWDNSQWRQYRVYNYDSKRKKWRHLYYDLEDKYPHGSSGLLSTPLYVRASGVDIVEKGPQPGLIKINYGAYDGNIYDTIIKPTYTPITDETL